MSKNQPLVTIGIPTYNRVEMLKRSIECALNQDYENIEVIVSDNASTDGTETLCKYYSDNYAQFRYVRHPVNRGATVNFSTALNMASGKFFMWLGDDDWIDSNYVSSCIQHLINDSNTTLVSGVPVYYRYGKKQYDGKIFSLLQTVWWLRVLSYYWQVADNGMFYGLMRTEQVQKIKMPNTMGGDWLLIANVASAGKIKTILDTSVYRELGGATASYQQIVASLGLSKLQGIFPMSTIAMSAWMDIVKNGVAYQHRTMLSRFIIACLVFAVIITKPIFHYRHLVIRLIKKYVTNRLAIL